MIAGSVFCEVPHPQAIRRQHNSTLQDVVFLLEDVLSPLAVEKGEAEAGALYTPRCDVL